MEVVPSGIVPRDQGRLPRPTPAFERRLPLDGEGDAPPTNIYVSSFYMDVNLVSYSQWQAVYNYATNNGFNFANAGSGKAADHPVQTVEWYDCVKWSNARSQQAGLAPVYDTDAGLTQVYRNGDEGTVVYPNWGANGYRLPTKRNGRRRRGAERAACGFPGATPSARVRQITKAFYTTHMILVIPGITQPTRPATILFRVPLVHLRRTDMG